jgi:hypothetical protein
MSSVENEIKHLNDRIAHVVRGAAGEILEELAGQLREARAELDRLKQELDDERRLRKQQNTKLYAGYLSGMRALQGMTNAFGPLGDFNQEQRDALSNAYAEIEHYLKHHAPTNVLFECTHDAPNFNKYEFLSKHTGETLTLYYSDGFVIRGEILSIGSKYVRMMTVNGTATTELATLVKVTK